MAEKQRQHGHHTNTRHVDERLLISGQLVLETPAHFGGSEGDDSSLDMTLLRDEMDGRALLPGATLAGALRNYLRQRLHGYSAKEDGATIVLFGPPRTSGEDDTSDQSAVIVDDSWAENERISLRDGVRIDPRSRTAFQDESGGAKFDIELLEAGTVFPLNIEVVLTAQHPAEQVLPYVALALKGLENGEIRLGLRKHRGYGQCNVENWTVSRYDLHNNAGLCDWLSTPVHKHRVDAATGDTLAEALKIAAADDDGRAFFDIQATFSLEGSSLLIRSGFGEADLGADMVHLHAQRKGERVPVIPGTSWAGIVRHRARRIANTIAASVDAPIDEGSADPAVVRAIFGDGPQTGALVGTASKALFDETDVTKGHTLYQTRVRIDRFTGGSYPGGLFEQAPVYGTAETRVGFHMRIRDPEDYEKGLLLLVLKDLWTGDLPVGGEASVGRGRLTGLCATLTERAGNHEKQYTLVESSPGLGLDETEQRGLQGYVDALWAQLEKEATSD